GGRFRPREAVRSGTATLDTAALPIAYRLQPANRLSSRPGRTGVRPWLETERPREALSGPRGDAERAAHCGGGGRSSGEGSRRRGGHGSNPDENAAPSALFSSADRYWTLVIWMWSTQIWARAQGSVPRSSRSMIRWCSRDLS